MGIYDRDYYQDDAPQGVQLSRPQSVVIQLVIVNAALFLVNMFTRDNWLFTHMAATPEVWQKPWLLWKVVTYGFAHSPKDLFHIIFNMFALWMLGREVEFKYGGREFLCIYMVSLVLGGVVWTLRYLAVDTPVTPTLVGASGAVTAIVLLFCLNFPKRTILLFMVIPTPAWVLGAIIIVLNLFSFAGAGEGSGVAYDVHLVGAAVAFIYFKSGIRFSSFLPAGGKRKGKLSVGGTLKALKPKPKLRVYEGDDEDSYRELDELGDKLLDKVHREGEESLTTKERRILEDYSRRMRQKHR